MMTSEYQAKELNRHLYVDEHIKADNKLLYYSVDIIHKAISNEQRIKFKYIEYTAEKKRIHKHNGIFYEFSPYALLWHNDYYYVLGHSEKHKSITKFRVDRIDKAELMDARAAKKSPDFDPVIYLKNIFSMYDGQMQSIRLRCDADMMKVILDRFGREIHTTTCENNQFIADVNISVSPTFYGWLFGFGGKIQVISPESVRKDYIKHAKAILKIETC
jgi:predicted DNA-binding transcriptional regulator YafY